MKFIVAENYEKMSERAADILAAQVILKEDSVLGLATGSSPIGTYDCLAGMYSEGRIDFSHVTTINLDEYKGMTHDNPQSYWYFMNEHFYSRVNVKPENTFVPDGSSSDEKKACGDYDRIIREAGGIDLQLLGLGPDGHIGFNEPADCFPNGTHCVKLEESTIEANKRFFAKKEDVPRYAYTMGVGTIMRAGKVVMVVSGSSKAGIVKEAFFGKVRPEVPASILQFHPDCTVVLDRDAAEQIRDLI